MPRTFELKGTSERSSSQDTAPECGLPDEAAPLAGAEVCYNGGHESRAPSTKKRRTMADVQPLFLWETPHCLRGIYVTALMSPFSNEIPRYHGIWLLYWCLGDSHCGFGERDPGVPGPRRMVLTACNLDLRRQGFGEAQGSLVLLCLLLLPDQTAQRHELTGACRVYIFLPVLPPEDVCVSRLQWFSGSPGSLGSKLPSLTLLMPERASACPGKRESHPVTQ